MRINTRTDKLDLTKQEERDLARAKKLLVDIAKHGNGTLADVADVAADKIGEVQRELTAEPVAAPY